MLLNKLVICFYLLFLMDSSNCSIKLSDISKNPSHVKSSISLLKLTKKSDIEKELNNQSVKTALFNAAFYLKAFKVKELNEEKFFEKIYVSENESESDVKLSQFGQKIYKHLENYLNKNQVNKDAVLLKDMPLLNKENSLFALLRKILVGSVIGLCLMKIFKKLNIKKH